MMWENPSRSCKASIYFGSSSITPSMSFAPIGCIGVPFGCLCGV